MFHDLVYSPDIENDPNLFPQVERATRSFAKEAGDSAKEVKVEWNRHNDINGDLIRLTLRDKKGEVHEDFGVRDFELQRERLPRRFRRLYVHLFLNRSRVLLGELDDLINAGGSA